MNTCTHAGARRFGPYRQPGTLEAVHVIWCQSCGAIAIDAGERGVFMLPQTKPELATIARKVARAGVERMKLGLAEAIDQLAERLLKPPTPRE